MSTVTPLPLVESDRLNNTVMGNVLAELAWRRVSQRQAARALGISEQAFSDRVRGRTRLTVDDLERLAELLDVEPGELVTRRARRGASTRDGEVKLPRLDSNQQPSD